MAGSSGAVIAAVIMAVQPLLGVIVNFITTRAVPKLLTILFMLTGLAGVVMVISKGDVSTFVEKDANISAYLFILLGALCFVIYTIGGSSFSKWSPLRYSTLTSLYGTISIIIIVSIGTLLGWLKTPSVSAVKDVSGALFYTAFIAGVLAFLFGISGID